MSDVLVDSSVWIDFFRGQEPAVACVDALLADDRAAVTGAIVAEVASGARTLAQFEQIRNQLNAVGAISDPPDLWQRVAEARFRLARRGVQANLVDLSIAVTASTHGHSLVTRDHDFEAIGTVVLLELDLI